MVDQNRMVDRELALRFCAFRLIGDIAHFKKYESLDEFLTVLNERLDNPKEISDEKLNELVVSFDVAMTIRSELSLKFEKFSGVELNGAAASDYAVSEIKSNRAVGCLVVPSQDGQVSVGAKQLHRIGKTSRVREFLRDAADLGEFDEAAFMAHARLVFPRLVFYDDLDVEIGTLPQRFTQGMRPKLTRALAALNDVLPKLLDDGVHSSVVGKAFEAATGFAISIESGRTRSRQKLMRLRDVTQGDQTYRCEWHLKLEAQEGRIHFYFGPLLHGEAAGKLFIGKFCKHLAT